MTRAQLLEELLVERYQPVPPRPQDRILPPSEAEAHRNRLVLDREVAAYEREHRG